MGSMEKIKPDTNALKLWKQNYKGPYVLSSKLDGISALYSTENGIKKLFTRGNGTQGLDISYLIPHLQLPQIEDITIRGELLLTKQTFQDKYSSTYKNVRNMIGGVMTTKKIDQSKWDDIDFVGYEVINPVLKPSQQMQWLSDNNVITVSKDKIKFGYRECDLNTNLIFLSASLKGNKKSQNLIKEKMILFSSKKPCLIAKLLKKNFALTIEPFFNE